MTFGSQRGPRSPAALRGSDLAIVVVGCALMLLALAALFAVGVASWLFGSGWLWPGGVPAAVHELGGLISGRVGDGLDHTVGRVGLYTLLVIVELLAIVVAVLMARMATQTIRPADARSGLASRAEASAALGRERLTKQRAAEIRPDLYSGRQSKPEPT